MAEVEDLSTTDASNTARFPEAMALSSVNNGARALEGLLARHHQDVDAGMLATATSTTAYTIASNKTISSYSDGLTVRAQIHATSTGACTLNVDAVGAQNIVWNDGSQTQLTTGDLIAGQIYTFVYDLGNTVWVVMNSGENQALTVTTTGTQTLTNKTITLGGDLSVNGNQITSADGTDLIDIPNGTIDLQTASTSRVDITDSGVRLGGANARVTTVLDEDAMGSDSATALATQQSIKAYADSVAGTTQTLGTAQATTSGTSKTFGSLPAGINRICFIFNGVTGSGTDNTLIQIGDSGGLETTGYTSNSDTNGTNVTSTAGFIIRTPSAAALYGTMELRQVDTNIWVASHACNFANTGSPSGGGGRTVLDSALTQVAILWTGTDTFTAGSVNIQYE